VCGAFSDAYCYTDQYADGDTDEYADCHTDEHANGHAN
jgi:hypothetical protein